MINKISQNTAELLPTRFKQSAAGIGRIQNSAEVNAANVTELVQSANQNQQSPEQPLEINDKEIEQVVEKLSEFAQSVQRQLNFSVDENSGRTVIKVIDGETGETIRHIPQEEVLNMQKQLRETSEQMFGGNDSGAALLFQGKA